MRITITAASRRDEILQRKADYESREARNKAIRDDQSRRYRSAQQSVFSKVEDEIRRQLGDKIGELQIRVEARFERGIEVSIGNDRGGPRRSPNASLTWSWTAKLGKNGEVVKESSSWSGLEATTLDQIADLKLCVEQLELINTMDWAQLLDVTLPNWDDYYTNEGIEDLGQKPNFDQELVEADLEEAVGNNVLVKAREGRTYRGDVYFQILRDSGSQYTVKEAPAQYVEKILNGQSWQYGNREITTIDELMNEWAGSPMRIRKVNFMNMIYTPVQLQNF